MRTAGIERGRRVGNDGASPKQTTEPLKRILLEYSASDGLTTAEVTYCYDPNEFVHRNDGTVVSVGRISVGEQICLEDGGCAVVTASSEIAWEPYDPTLSPRIIGTVRYTGVFQRIDFRVFGGETLGTTPEHAFWSIDRAGWHPIASFSLGEALLTAGGNAARLEWISPPYMSQCELRNIEVEKVHRYQVGNTPTGGIWTHNGMENGCQVPKAKTSLGIDDAIESGDLSVVNAHRAGVSRGSNIHEHHIFPQEYRQMFVRRGIDVDDFVVDVDVATHGAIHGGGNWRLARDAWEGEWNARIVRELRDATRRYGKRLSPEQIQEIGEDLARFYGIGTDFHRYSRAASQ